MYIAMIPPLDYRYQSVTKILLNNNANENENLKTETRKGPITKRLGNVQNVMLIKTHG